MLFVGHDAMDITLIGGALREAGFECVGIGVQSRQDFETELMFQRPDLVLASYAATGFDGREALEILLRRAPDIPLIFVTGSLGEEVAIELLKQGATDCVLKTHLGRLAPSMRRAIRGARERRERERFESELRRSHVQLRALTNHLQTVREEERTRIAREVHDDLGQALTALKLDLASLGRKLGRAPGFGRRVSDMLAHVDATIATVRMIATELRPGVLDNLGMVAAVEWQAADFQRRTGVPCVVTVEVPELRLAPDLETVCFRIFQEALTNIIRHAQATQVTVRLTRSEGFLILVVRDNGRGITENEANPRSIGLLGMKERASQVGGDVFIAGLPGHGTTVTLRLPLSTEDRLWRAEGS